MAKSKTSVTRPGTQMKKLHFLIGSWHTKGEILHGAAASAKEIRGMDTYEWISGGSFILHRVDVFMGNERTEIVEIIGYDKRRRSYCMNAFDDHGEATTMYAMVEKPGVMKLEDQKMRAVLTASKEGNTMVAKWELAVKEGSWKPWMEIRFSK